MLRSPAQMFSRPVIVFGTAILILTSFLLISNHDTASATPPFTPTFTMTIDDNAGPSEVATIPSTDNCVSNSAPFPDGIPCEMYQTWSIPGGQPEASAVLTSIPRAKFTIAPGLLSVFGPGLTNGTKVGALGLTTGILSGPTCVPGALNVAYPVITLVDAALPAYASGPWAGAANGMPSEAEASGPATLSNPNAWPVDLESDPLANALHAAGFPLIARYLGNAAGLIVNVGVFWSPTDYYTVIFGGPGASALCTPTISTMDFLGSTTDVGTSLPVLLRQCNTSGAGMVAAAFTRSDTLAQVAVADGIGCTDAVPPTPSPTPTPVPPSPTPQPPSPIEYVALGDSIATGFDNPAGHGYVDVYSGYVASDLSATVHLTNLAVNGLTSQGLLNMLTNDAAVRDAVSHAQIVTWDIGGNDFLAAHASYQNHDCGGIDNQACLRAGVAQLKANWSAIIAQLQSLVDPSVVDVRTMDLYNTDLGPDLATVKPYIDDINNYIATTTSAHGIPMARVYAAFNGISGLEDPVTKGYLTPPDTIHPNSMGHRVIADLFRGLGYAPGGPGPIATPPPELVPNQPVASGGTVTTDTEHDGATPADPIETTIKSPNSGVISIFEHSSVALGPYHVLGSSVLISAPPASAGNPLQITFLLDATALTGGANATNIVVYKNGLAVPPCDPQSPGTANPDPCVASRTRLPSFDVQITVLTSTASTWELAGPESASVGGAVSQLTAGGSTSLMSGSSSAGYVLAAGLVVLATSVFGGAYVWRRRLR